MENRGPYNQQPPYNYPNAPPTEYPSQISYPNVPPTGYPSQISYPNVPPTGYPSQTGYPHPPPHHQAGFQQTPPPVIVMQPQMQQQFTGQVRVGSDPIRIQCQSCNRTVITDIRHAPNQSTHLMALCLCCCLCWPCVCLPYCTESCQDANHYCPNCNAFIGKYDNFNMK